MIKYRKPVMGVLQLKHIQAHAPLSIIIDVYPVRPPDMVLVVLKVDAFIEVAWHLSAPPRD